MTTQNLNIFGDLLITNEGCHLTLSRQSPGRYMIYSVLTSPHLTNRGYATRLFSRMMKWATSRKIKLVLCVGAFGHKTLPDRKLFEFYGKFGFIRRGKSHFMDFNP